MNNCDWYNIYRFLYIVYSATVCMFDVTLLLRADSFQDRQSNKYSNRDRNFLVLFKCLIQLASIYYESKTERCN